MMYPDRVMCIIRARKHNNEGQYLQNAKRATKVIFHRAATVESARAIAETLQYRRYDRRTHMLIYPDNPICVIRGRLGERLTHEQQNFPPYDYHQVSDHYREIADHDEPEVESESDAATPVSLSFTDNECEYPAAFTPERANCPRPNVTPSPKFG